MLARVDTRPRHRATGRPKEKSADGFLKWLRGRRCALADHRAGGCGILPGHHPIEAAHVDHAGGKGVGTKVADRFAIPLCSRHHAEQSGQIGDFKSRGGWPTFELKYGIEAVVLAAAYWEAWPGRIAWEKSRAD